MIELARLIKGWTVPIGRKTSAVTAPFVFAANRPNPGAQTILGARYNDGLAEGERTLHDLALRLDTAQFLATEMARRFVER